MFSPKKLVLVLLAAVVLAVPCSYGPAWAQSKKPAQAAEKKVTTNPSQGKTPPSGVSLSKRNQARLEVDAARAQRDALIKSLLERGQ